MRLRSSDAGSASCGEGASGSCNERSIGRPRIGSSTAMTSATSVTSVAPCFKQAVAAVAAGIERRARHRENLAALFERHPRRDQRAGAPRRLDHDDAQRQPGDQPVAAGKIARPRLPADRHFGDERACRQDRFGEPDMLGRIDAVVAAGQHRDRCRSASEARCAPPSMPRASPDAMPKPASPNSRAMRSANFTPAAEALRAPTIATIGMRQRGRLAAHGKQRRRIVDHLQPQRVVRLAERHQADAHRGGRLELALGIGARADAGRAGRAAAAGELGQARRAPLRALPQWFSSVRKVRGPTFSLRISRSQSIRCSSVRLKAGRSCPKVRPHCPCQPPEWRGPGRSYNHPWDVRRGGPRGLGARKSGGPAMVNNTLTAGP